MAKQTKRPTVSVIMPCYNLGRYIDEAIESVLASSFSDFEIIIVDDGSTDTATLAKLKGIKHEKIKVIFAENGGVSKARNRALKASRGKYVLPLDADDKIGPDFLAKAVRLLDARQDIAIVASWYKAFGFRNYVMKTKRIKDVRELLCRNCLGVSSVIRREALAKVGGYAEDMRGYEDWSLWVSLLGRGYKAEVIPAVHYYYRTRRDSKVNVYSDRIRFELIRKVVRNNHAVYVRHLEYLVPELIRRYEEKAYTLRGLMRAILPVWLKLLLKRILPESWWKNGNNLG